MGSPSALAFLDLDDLKGVNDRTGHTEGDRVLEYVGAALAESTRSTDVVGRLGGDEFAMLLPNTGAAQAKALFDRLHHRLVQAMRERDWPIGCSVGVAILPSAPACDDDAITYADRLMYRAKRKGKNRVIYGEYHPRRPDGARGQTPEQPRRRQATR